MGRGGRGRTDGEGARGELLYLPLTFETKYVISIIFLSKMKNN